MTEPLQEHAKRLGYQATYAGRGVRLWKRGRFITLKDETGCRAYLRAVDRFLKKQQAT